MFAEWHPLWLIAGILLGSGVTLVVLAVWAVQDMMKNAGLQDE